MAEWRETLAPVERPRRARDYEPRAVVAGRQHGREPGAWSERYDRLTVRQREGLVAARRTLRAFPEQLTRSTCGVTRRGGTLLCDRPAGWKTDHEGEGACRGHDLAEGRRAEVAWLMAHRFSEELECSPWDGLLRAVRIAAGKVAYTQWVLSTARQDLELEGRRPQEMREKRQLAGPDGQVRDEWVGTGIFVHPDTGEPLGGDDTHVRNLTWWVQKNELWVDRLARYSKAAVDAGVAERLVQQVELRAQALARTLNAALGALDDVDELPGQVRDALVARMRARVRDELLALEAEGAVIEGDAEPWSERESVA